MQWSDFFREDDMAITAMFMAALVSMVFIHAHQALSKPSVTKAVEPPAAVSVSSGSDEDYSESDTVSTPRTDVTETDTTSGAKAFDAPEFQFLKILNQLPDGTPRAFYPNARKIQTFESPLGTGKFLLALRVKGNEDPHFKHYFDGKKRNLELQVQITLNDTPKGPLYLGGELPRKMQLGLVTKGFCKVIIAVMHKLSPQAHASFGKNMDEPKNAELPHIVFPLWVAATKLVVTKKGDEPPKMGTELLESPEQKKKRTKAGINSPGELEAGDIITFSTNTMYVDFVEWKVTNLGALSSKDLGIFWGTMPLTVALYDVETPKLHTAESKRYYFRVSFVNTWHERTTEPAVIYDASSSSNGQHRSAPLSPELEESDSSNQEHSGSESESDSYLPEDGTQGHYFLPAVFVRWKKRGFSYNYVVSNKQGKRTVIQHHSAFATDEVPSAIRDFVKKSSKKMFSSPKSVEQIRSELNLMFISMDTSVFLPKSWYKHSICGLTAVHSKQLGLSPQPLKVLDIPGQYVLKEFVVCRPVSEVLWREEWLCVVQASNYTYAFFFHYSYSTRRPVAAIGSFDVIKVISVDEVDIIPFTDRFPACVIEGRAKCYNVGFASKEARSEFIKCFSRGAMDQVVDGDWTQNIEGLRNDCTSEHAMHFGSKRRTVVNDKRLYFGWQGSYQLVSNVPTSGTLLRQNSFGKAKSHEKLDKLSVSKDLAKTELGDESLCPLQLSVRLVSAARALAYSGSRENEQELLERSSDLKKLRMINFANTATNTQIMAFFINVYNALRLHAAYFLGQPSSMFGWGGFGTRTSYCIGSMVFSLNEIEHCILRKPLSPARIILNVATTDTPYTDMFLLDKSDARVSLTLNYGTKSSCSKLPVIEAENFEATINKASQDFLEEQLIVDEKKGSIRVPKICYWYGKDFMQQSDKKRKEFARDVAEELAEYMSEGKRQVFDRVLPNATFRFRRFNWTSRLPS